jgi:adenosylcobinamide-phosphate synthase
LRAGRAAGEPATGVAADLERGDLPAARAGAGRHLVSRPTDRLGAPHVASAAVESVAENLTDSVVGPLAVYAVLGLPGAAAYRAVNTADAMIGYRTGALEHFGKVAARLDDALNLVPARIAALALVAAAAGVGSPARAVAAAWRDAGRTASPNAGCTMAAMAGALGVTLEKPGHYRLGAGPLPGAADVRRAVRVMGRAAALSALASLLVLPAVSNSIASSISRPRRPARGARVVRGGP